MDDPGVVAAIRAGLRERADAGRAAAMQAYMRSAMPFLGVPRPVVRTIVRAGVRASSPLPVADLESTVRTLWDEADVREERYAANELLSAHTTTGRLELVGLYEYLATTGAWWDHVDALAHHVSALHDAHPAQAARIVRAWSISDDLWLRRLAIIGQLDRKDRLDPGLLADVIEPNLADREFFIRKAIGWALRQHARVDPDWVRGFVEGHPGLSGLSRREALKHLR